MTGSLASSFIWTGGNFIHGAVIAPEGAAAEREDFRAVVLKGRLAEAVRRTGRGARGEAHRVIRVVMTGTAG